MALCTCARLLPFAVLGFVAGVYPHAAADGRDPNEEDGLVLLEGHYRYAGDAERDHAQIQRSIDRAIRELGWLGRRIAESRLANHQELPQEIEIARAGDDVAITMGTFRGIAPRDGSPRSLVAPNGRDAELSYRVDADRILQFFVFEHAKRKSTYRFDEAGRLVMSVYMTSEKLASPISYDLVYARHDG